MFLDSASLKSRQPANRPTGTQLGLEAKHNDPKTLYKKLHSPGSQLASLRMAHRRHGEPGRRKAPVRITRSQAAASRASRLRRFLLALLVLPSVLLGAICLAQAPNVDSFNPGLGIFERVRAFAIQPDGRVIVGGNFTSLGGQERNNLGRLHPNGTLDAAFPAQASSAVIALGLQVDGKILVAGEFPALGGQSRNYVGRLHPSGTLDTGFNPQPDNAVNCLAIQADGKIVIGGAFTRLGGLPHPSIGRLNSDGTPDHGFNPGTDGVVRLLALQPDGKILLVGQFSVLCGQLRNGCGRLNPDGTLDTGFNLGVAGVVDFLAVQTDGRILISGWFPGANGEQAEFLVRLNANGARDTSFGPRVDNVVYSLSEQADGKIILAGEFSSLGGQPRQGIGRLNASGTLDLTFNAQVEGQYPYAYALAVQSDGKILVGGLFTSLGGQPRQGIGRLGNTITANQHLAYDGNAITWVRDGASPEVWRSTFEASTNGTDWTWLGRGDRIAGGWRLPNVSVVPGSTIRGRGFAAGGEMNGSTWFVEARIGPPLITSDLTANGQQGKPFSYFVTATNSPSGFLIEGLPEGLAYDPTSGAISGVPAVFGNFTVNLAATNYFGADRRSLLLMLSSAAPVITSALAATGKQGEPFRYTIMATNAPMGFIASGLPEGLGLDPATGVIAGTPSSAGIFAVSLSATNLFGSDRRTLELTLLSGEPQFSSALVVNGTELAPLNYALTAYPPADGFSVTELPPGLKFDPNTATISGTPVYAGTNQAAVRAWNPYGTNSASLEFRIAYAALPGLVITNVIYLYSRPYLLDFMFSLRDGPDPTTAHAVVRASSQMSVTCREAGLAINPLETAFIVENGDRRQFKAYLVLDYSRSMTALANGDANGNEVSDAIDNMEAAAKELLRQLPPTAQVGLYEFHADWEDPIRLHGPTSDRAALDAAMDGIWRTLQLPDASAGSRCWDALLAAVNDFGPPDPDENRYVVFISDGYDTSSQVLPANVIAAAQAKWVRLYCVAYGTLIDGATLAQLTAQTGGRHFRAENAEGLASAFALLGKDLDGQYLLRWATLRRNATPFTPSFEVKLAGYTHQFTAPADYVATNYGTNKEVFYGALRLVADAEEGADAVLLRTTYAPRNIRKLRLHYRPNYRCQPVLLSTSAGEILHGWTMSETPDGAGGYWLELNSPNPGDNTRDIPYGALGNLVQFQFTGLPSPAEAFRRFEVDNTVYASLPGPPSFTLLGTGAFVSTNTPPAILNAEDLPPARVSLVYSNLLSATGGTTPYTWSLTAGALPDGLSLDAGTGLIHGVPRSIGTNAFTLRVTGADNFGSTLSARLVVMGAPPPLIGALDGSMGFASDQFSFGVGGLPGQVVILETSTNLVDWMAFRTNVIGASPIEVIEPVSLSMPSRFYRARLP